MKNQESSANTEPAVENPVSKRVEGPLVGTKGAVGAGSPDRENPYDVLFP